VGKEGPLSSLQNEINGSSEDIELSVSMSRWRNGTSFDLNDLEYLINVAREDKEWISAYALKRLGRQ
jgi:hypothetical protein